MPIRITCINKAGGQHENPHVAISHLGWTNETTGNTGKSTRLDVYEWLKKSADNQAFVRDRYGNVAYLYPRESAYGTKFVQTHADGKWSDNLLALAECVS